MQDGVKSRECDQGCENRQVFLVVVQTSTRIVGLLWSRRKLWGTVRRVRNAALLRPNERLMMKNRKTNERWMFGPYGSRGEVDNHQLSTGAMQVGMVGRRISLQTPLLPELFGLRLYFWRSCFFAVIVFKTSLHASSTGLQQCNIELSVGYRKGVWLANFYSVASPLQS